MRIGHDVVPGACRQRAAGHVVHRRVVVIAIPDAAAHRSGIAAEPGVLIAICGAGLADHVDALAELRALAGAFLDDLLHHAGEFDDLVERHRLRLRRRVAVVAIEQIALAVADFDGGVRRDLFAAVDEGAIGGGMFEQDHVALSDRKRGRVFERRGDAEPAAGFDDLGAADARIALADRLRQLNGDRVQGFRQSHGERHGAGIAAAVIMDAVIADAGRPVGDDGRRLETAGHQRGEIDIGLEGGAGLARGVGRAVELACAIIPSADDGAHGAVRLHDDRGALLGMKLRPCSRRLVSMTSSARFWTLESSVVRTLSTRLSPSLPSCASLRISP